MTGKKSKFALLVSSIMVVSALLIAPVTPVSAKDKARAQEIVDRARITLDAFMRNIHSVLLATGSFWQGVDVPGETLSCLIIDKLPFDSPGEPLVSARIDAIRDGGGNPFLEYQVPSAIISLKQGLGRLIRKRTDRGLLSVLDRRLITSRYGKFFLNSLPHIPITHKIVDISRFFETMKGETACPADPGN